jgi:catechol 2,3-dioxygenase-like lactoylglutathione lyase family enzyme
VGRKPSFWLAPLTTGEPNRQVHIAFQAPDRVAVHAFFEAAVSAVLHHPRVWPEYHPTYYGAFVRDPDGNNVEAVCHTPK